jgi:hypothetical protein
MYACNMNESAQVSIDPCECVYSPCFIRYIYYANFDILGCTYLLHKCMYVSMCTFAPVALYSNGIHMFTMSHTYICTCIHTCIRTYMHTHKNAYIHTYIHTNIQTHLHVYTSVHVYMYADTHTVYQHTPSMNQN